MGDCGDLSLVAASFLLGIQSLLLEPQALAGMAGSLYCEKTSRLGDTITMPCVELAASVAPGGGASPSGWKRVSFIRGIISKMPLLHARHAFSCHVLWPEGMEGLEKGVI